MTFNIAIVAKAKQGYIYKYMLENNLCAAELARQLGLRPSRMGEILNFKVKVNGLQSKDRII